MVDNQENSQSFSGSVSQSIHSNTSGVAVYPIDNLWEQNILDGKYRILGQLAKKGTCNDEVREAEVIENVIDEYGH